MKTHSVKAGDCMLSIATDNGFYWETLWDHPRNAKLRQKRADPFQLVEGDQVFVPDIQERPLRGSTGNRHTVRIKGIPASVQVQVFDAGHAPMSDQPFVLEVGGRKVEGRTTGDGVVQAFVPHGEKEAKLTVGEGERAGEARSRHRPPRPARRDEGRAGAARQPRLPLRRDRRQGERRPDPRSRTVPAPRGTRADRQSRREDAPRSRGPAWGGDTATAARRPPVSVRRRPAGKTSKPEPVRPPRGLRIPPPHLPRSRGEGARLPEGTLGRPHALHRGPEGEEEEGRRLPR